MRLVLIGGAPGIGKSSVCRSLLGRAAEGSALVQWVDVDALWLHQPWRVDARTRAMVQANLAAVMSNAQRAGIDVLLVTWVFQNEAMHALVARQAPEGVAIETVQLVAEESTWRDRFTSDPARPPIDGFYEGRYADANATPADHRIETDGRDPGEVAALLAEVLGL